jgi:hypothetical protein
LLLHVLTKNEKLIFYKENFDADEGTYHTTIEKQILTIIEEE